MTQGRRWVNEDNLMSVLGCISWCNRGTREVSSVKTSCWAVWAKTQDLPYTFKPGRYSLRVMIERLQVAFFFFWCLFWCPGKGDQSRLGFQNEALLQINNSGYVNNGVCGTEVKFRFNLCFYTSGYLLLKWLWLCEMSNIPLKGF